MGTNYYASTEKCPHCGRGDEQIHIGKSSGGWEFLFRSDEERGLTSWKAWREYLAAPGAVIADEYGYGHTLADLEALIEGKRGLRTDARYDQPDEEGYRFSRFPEFS